MIMGYYGGMPGMPNGVPQFQPHPSGAADMGEELTDSRVVQMKNIPPVTWSLEK
jgi:hypothetical protein